MKKTTVNNSLNGFKALLQSAKVNGLKLRSTIYNNSMVERENDFAPVAHTQSNSFALDRNGNLSWCEYGKATQWKFNFEDNEIIKYYTPTNYMVFKFDDPSFFGF